MKTAHLSKIKSSNKEQSSSSSLSSSHSSKSSSSEYEKHPKLVKPIAKEKFRNNVALGNVVASKNIAKNKNVAVTQKNFDNRDSRDHQYPKSQSVKSGSPN